MKAKKDKPKAKAKVKKSALIERVAELEERVTRLEQAQIAPIPPEPQAQSLPEGGLPAQGVWTPGY